MRLPRWDAVAQQPSRDEEATSAFATAEEEAIDFTSPWELQQQPSSSAGEKDEEEVQQPAARKFCIACGTKLPVTAKFCSACGERQP